MLHVLLQYSIDAFSLAKIQARKGINYIIKLIV